MKYTIKELEKMMDEYGSLYLRGTQITALPDNLTVGGYLDLRGTQINNPHHYKILKYGDCVLDRYIYADGYLTPIKRVKKIGEYTFYVGKIKGNNVLSDGKLFAHCATIAEGIDDIAFKSAEDRGAEQYKSLTLDSELPKAEAVTMYRIITGACKAGTNRFLDSLKEIKETYTVREMIELTKGQYGAGAFEKFFTE